MTSIFKKIATSIVGMAMAIGVGIGLSTSGGVREARAGNVTLTATGLGSSLSPTDSASNSWISDGTTGSYLRLDSNQYLRISSALTNVDTTSGVTVSVNAGKYGNGTYSLSFEAFSDANFATGITTEKTVTATDKNGSTLNFNSGNSIAFTSNSDNVYFKFWASSTGSIRFFSFSITYVEKSSGTNYTTTISVTGGAKSTTNASTSFSSTTTSGDVYLTPSTGYRIPDDLTTFTVSSGIATISSRTTSGNDVKISLTGVGSNFTIGGSFTVIPSHNIGYAAGDHGSYDGSTTRNFSVYEDATHTVLSAEAVGISAVSGYEFAGWNDGTNDYAVGSSYTMPKSDVTLTAQWTIQKVYEWIKTDLGDLTSSDVFVIVGNDGSNYAMSNNNGTTSAPTAVSVTVTNNKITSSVANTIKWNLMVSDGTYNFYPNGDTTNKLYCTNTNNGVRVGSTNSSPDFTLDESGYLKHTSTSRYVGIYSSQDWRCYSSTSTNIGGQTFSFFKGVEQSTDPKVVIDDTETQLSITEKETVSVSKTLTLSYVTMSELSYLYDNTKLSVVADNANSKITITGSVAGGPYNILIKKGESTLYTISFTVTYNNTVTVAGEGGATSVAKGATLSLTATSSKGSDTFTWSSSNDAVATVSNGVVTALECGKVTITATSVNWETEGTLEITVTFSGVYSRANWYNSEKLDSDAGTTADADYILSTIPGSDTLINDVTVSGDNTVAYDKAGGLGFGKSGAAGSITLEMKTGYYLKSVSIWGASWDAGMIPSVTATNASGNSNAVTAFANGGEFVTKGVAMNDAPLTYTFASDAKTITIATPGTSKSRFIIYQMDLVFDDITAESISLSDSSATLMQTEAKTLKALISPRNYNVTLPINWSSSNTDVATVSSGVISASSTNTGTATVTAGTSVGSPICNVKIIKLAASSINIRGDNATGLTSGTDQELDLNGKIWNCTQVQKYSNDYTPQGATSAAVYSKNGLRIGSGSTGGSITNSSTYSTFKFNKVIVAHCLSTDGTTPYAASFVVKGSDTQGGTDYTATANQSGMLTTYTFSTPVSYVTVSSSGGQYISSLTFSFSSPEETEISAAEFILGLTPDRGQESIGYCTLSNGTYKAAKKFLYDAGSTVKQNFQESTDAVVASARERYMFWANNIGDKTPYDGEEPVLVSKLFGTAINSDSNSVTIVAVVISMISITALGGFFFLRKRKEER